MIGKALSQLAQGASGVLLTGTVAVRNIVLLSSVIQSEFSKMSIFSMNELWLWCDIRNRSVQTWTSVWSDMFLTTHFGSIKLASNVQRKFVIKLLIVWISHRHAEFVYNEGGSTASSTISEQSDQSAHGSTFFFRLSLCACVRTTCRIILVSVHINTWLGVSNIRWKNVRG